jgi:hypothetical protein
MAFLTHHGTGQRSDLGFVPLRRAAASAVAWRSPGAIRLGGIDLEWLENRPTSEGVLEVLHPLIEEARAPLVFKSDRGSVFTAHATGDVLNSQRDHSSLVAAAERGGEVCGGFLLFFLMI